MRKIAVLACVLALLTACGDDGGGDATATPTTQPTRGPSPVTTPPPKQTPVVEIRDIEVGLLPEVQAAVAEEGGTFEQTSVIYADLTGDGADEAIIPMSADGTQGDIGVIVYTVNGDAAQLLFQEFPAQSLGLQVEVRGDKLAMVQPSPGPDDPECCPAMLQETLLGWNGQALAVESVTLIANPDVPTPAT